jgi:TolB-like protein
MSSKITKGIISLLSVVFITGTAYAEEKKVVDPMLAIPTAQAHQTIDKTIQDLANRLFSSSRISKEAINDIAITSFVDLHQFDKTTHFGRTLSEGFFDELFIRGFNVSDFRGQGTLSINKEGEYFLTRDVKLLNKDVQSDYILVGTYTIFENKILINARIMDNQNGRILASARANYITNDCKVLLNCKKPRIINIVSEEYKKNNSRENVSVVDNKEMSIKQHFVKKQPIEEEVIEVKTKTPFPLVNLIK